MIREIGRELEMRLHAFGVPITVVDGPERGSTTTWGRERIVIEYDDKADAFGPPRSQHVNPRHRYTVSEACKLTIYAQSTVAGPTVFEHRRRAKRLRDEVLHAMDYVAAVRKNRWNPVAGRFLTPPDLAGTDKPGGAVYELTFTFDHAVEIRTWVGAATPEGNVAAVRSATRVSRAHGPDDDDDPNTPPASAETACGA
jgi:hypothetical protein